MRPSKEDVDTALAVCDRDNLSASSYPVILAEEVRALRDRYREPPPNGITVREAAKQRYALSGADAQALEGALQQVERELYECRSQYTTAAAASEAAELRIVELREELGRCESK